MGDADTTPASGRLLPPLSHVMLIEALFLFLLPIVVALVPFTYDSADYWVPGIFDTSNDANYETLSVAGHAATADKFLLMRMAGLYFMFAALTANFAYTSTLIGTLRGMERLGKAGAPLFLVGSAVVAPFIAHGLFLGGDVLDVASRHNFIGNVHNGLWWVSFPFEVALVVSLGSFLPASLAEMGRRYLQQDWQ